MKNAKLIVVCTLLIVSTYIDAQSWQWATHAGASLSDAYGSVTMDGNGNIYTVLNSIGGTFYFNTDTFNTNGVNDFYVAKYDNNGNEIWLRQFGGLNSNFTTIKFEEIRDIVFNQTNNSLLITGEYIETCNFGCTNLTPAATNDRQIYLAQLDLNGNCMWSKQFGSVADDYSNAIALDSNGNIYMTGSVTNAGIFDSFSVSPGSFLAKFDNTGNCSWVKSLSPSSTLLFESDGLIYSDNYLYILGINNEDTLQIDTLLLNLPNSYGKILSQFDLNGNIQWARPFAGPNGAYAAGMRMGKDDNKNIYVTGAFNSPVGIFQNDTINSTNSNKEMYICKFDQSGNILWVQHISASQAAVGAALYTDPIGNTYVTGAFSGSANFGAYNINSSTSSDVFIARYDSSGNCLGVINLGEGSGTAIISDNNGAFYVGGSFLNIINFGTTSFTSYGSSDIFLAKHDVIMGIGEPEGRLANNRLLIYANPSAGTCTIAVPDEFLHEKNLILSVFDNIGNLIQQKTIELNEGKIKLNIEQQAKGLYYVTLRNQIKSYSGALVFE